MNLVSGDVRVGFDQLVDGSSISESLENQCDTDPGTSDLGLAGKNVRSAVNVITPVHGWFLLLGNTS
jgi:hypothetical protein